MLVPCLYQLCMYWWGDDEDEVQATWCHNAWDGFFAQSIDWEVVQWHRFIVIHMCVFSVRFIEKPPYIAKTAECTLQDFWTPIQNLTYAWDMYNL